MEASNLLMAALSKRFGGNFSLQDGVCALADARQQEAVIIEMPKNAASVTLHCTMGLSDLSPLGCRRMLEMNFQQGRSAGCWLALDEAGLLRLCSQMSMKALDEVIFCDWVSGFTKVAVELRDQLRKCCL
ncbi:hypothetical protein M2399_000087 [Pseudomonas sp. BIGb0450]|uniref:type III secretion system chaperone n=1 Tax=unclassified Pseudomonas TaxID=196821 RepID=UPI002166E5D3|nr:MULTISPECIES: type III secretion system chaperone [unclassified Pseudomonas]MCS3415915.1 hypothetical protein [Pseudomonas sp. BIGb0558]MCS3434678.1 hypothetical protein [Pseudomonas sp. BIGb0450]